MSSVDFEERPRKKPRFFVEPEPPAVEQPSAGDSATLDGNSTLPSVNDNEREPSKHEGTASHGSSTGFDVGLFTAVIGEEALPSTIKRLQELCGDDLQRGEINTH